MNQAATLNGSTTKQKAVRRDLLPADRCDAGTMGSSCGAQAFVHVLFPSGGELMFCRHHYLKYQASLVAAGADINDQSDRINEKPSPSATINEGNDDGESNKIFRRH